MFRLLIILTIYFVGVSTNIFAQKTGVKTNILYDTAILTPNLGLEFGIGQQSSLNISGNYNPWNLKRADKDNKKLVHWLIDTEFRYWLDKRFNDHFFGLHIIGGKYNICGYDVPQVFEKEYRYDGWVLGSGISYGYHWIWDQYWSMEFTLGIGYAHLEYDKYRCEKCAEKEGRFSKRYFGPTKAGISLIYMIK